MPFYRPTKAEIRRRVQSDFIKVFGNDAVLYEGTVEHALCEVLVGISHAAHGRLDQIYRDAFPHLASEAAQRKWAAFYNVFFKRATYATGITRFYGPEGMQVVQGQVITRADGVEHRTMESGTVAVGESYVALEIKARKPGIAGNTPQGTTWVPNPTIVGLTTVENVSGPILGGAEAELPAELLARLLGKLAEPPGGGKRGDYVRWAKQVPGVTRAWEFGRVPKLGHVTVLFMRDGDDVPFPEAPQIADVEAELLAEAPLHLHGLHVLSPIEKALSIELDLTVEDDADEGEVQAAIVKALQDMVAVRAAPHSTTGAIFYLSWISGAASAVAGVLDVKVVTPATDLVLLQWELATLATDAVTWTP